MEEVNESFCRRNDWEESCWLSTGGSQQLSAVFFMNFVAPSSLWSFCTLFTLTNLNKSNTATTQCSIMGNRRAFNLWAEGSANWGWSLNKDTLSQTCCKEDTIYCLSCRASADAEPGKAAAAFWVDETPHWANRASETSAENRWKIKSSNKYCRRLGNHGLIISHYAAIMAPFISKRAHLKEENAHELIKIIH